MINHKVVSVSFENKTQKVYDIEVEKYHNFALSSGVFVHNSVGGSLLAYCLYITSVDPLKYNLLFSRFISPARIDLPDIDMDFEDTKRDMVRHHLEELYGEDCVTGVSTFSKLKGRAAIRDVARVFNVPKKDVDPAAKSIVVRSGGDFRSDFSIEDAFDTFEDGIAFKKKYPDVSRIAVDLEGQIRGVGMHAAAMCISKESLKEGRRCNLATRKGGVTVANWDKYDSEYMGMMKLDVLGLNALTVLNESKKLIKKNHGVDIEWDKINLEDEKVYKQTIGSGHTVGCFQIGSLGLGKFCIDLQVNKFEELVDATSLWRPGTLRSGITREYVLRKTEQVEWKHSHPAIEELTKDTFGIILYQEQVMLLMYNLGGLGWKTCDTVRKVISKSQGDELFMKFKKEFADGCVNKKTLTRKAAEKLWDELSNFGSYSFNKCLSGDTTILIPSGSRNAQKRISLKQAFINKPKQIFTYNSKTKKIQVGKIKEIIKSGRKKVYWVIGRNNRLRKIKATLDHKFLTEKGWQHLKSLSVGDKILVKSASTILFGSDNPMFGKKGFKVNNKGIKRGKLPKYWKDQLSLKAKKRKIHGHTGHKHSEATKAILREKTTKRIANGEFPQTKTSIHRKIMSEMKRNKIWKGFVSEFNFNNRFCIDVADPKRRIAIECQGDYWHANPKFYSKRNQTQGRNVGRDKIKKKALKKDGWEVIELWECDINNNIDLCLLKIKNAISDTFSNPWEFLSIDAIEYAGIEETYDVYVDSSEHNFIANMFVVHNSHAVEYSLISFWDAYLKTYYPKEFMATSLTYGSDEKKEEYVEECRRLKLEVELPKVGISDYNKWITSPDHNMIYIPFCEIKGVGEKALAQIQNLRKNKSGFFKKDDKKKLPNKTILKSLDDMKVFEPEESLNEVEVDAVNHMFSFNISKDPMYKVRGIYKHLGKQITHIVKVSFSGRKGKDVDSKLYFGKMIELKFGYKQNVLKAQKGKGLGGIEGTGESLGGVYGFFRDESGTVMLMFKSDVYTERKYEIEHCEDSWIIVDASYKAKQDGLFCNNIITEEDLLSCKFGKFEFNLIKNSTYRKDEALKDCEECSLSKERPTAPVPPSIGRNNIAIVGEAPGSNEDRLGRGFIGRSGDLIWDELSKYNLKRRSFHITNIVKCFPSKSKTPTKKHLSICSSLWLKKELKEVKPVLILAFGNTPLNFFKEQEGGITALNATTEWLPEFDAWVCWCIHPASVLYHRENLKAFKEGIENFVNCYNGINN